MFFNILQSEVWVFSLISFFFWHSKCAEMRYEINSLLSYFAVLCMQMYVISHSISRSPGVQSCHARGVWHPSYVVTETFATLNLRLC